MTISVFKYSNYRDFLRDSILEKQERRGLSYRALAKRSHIGSPNFLQMVVRGKRNLTEDTARKVSKGLGLPNSEGKYFIALVRLERARTKLQQEIILKEMERALLQSNSPLVEDENIHSTWLNAVLLEMTGTQGELCEDEMVRKLSGLATRKDIQKALSFLKRRKYVLEKKSRIFEKNKVRFRTLNDTPSLYLQRNHLHYLKMAQDKIVCPLNEREFQGLTVAIAKEKIPHIKQQIRAFIEELNESLSSETNTNCVVRLECCLFKVVD